MKRSAEGCQLLKQCAEHRFPLAGFSYPLNSLQHRENISRCKNTLFLIDDIFLSFIYKQGIIVTLLNLNEE
jgi:hypothetical protein